MQFTIYFTDKYLTFSDCALDAPYFCVSAPIGRANVMKIFDSHNFVAIIDENPYTAFERFSEEFALVEAGGGVVRNALGEVLMIDRRGRWDLPKGHWERGETISECALREVEEETGVHGLRLGGLICRTMHSYNVYGKWELKITHWYAMSVDGVPALMPQTSEDIVRAEWCSPAQIDEHLQHTYPTIVEVMRRFRAEK